MRKAALHVLRFDRLRAAAAATRAPPLAPTPLAPVHIAEQLRLEEALFRADDRNWCIINAGGGGGAATEPDPTIVLGISGKPHRLCDTARVRRENVHLFRRFTGGGTVVVDSGTTFVSLICNKNAAPIPPKAGNGPRELMEWSGVLYARALARCGLDVGLFHEGGSGYEIGNKNDGGDEDSNNAAECFALRENDYVIGNKKFAGNAQGLSRERFVHHTSVLWDFAPETMRLLANPEKQPDYRQRRSHEEFLRRMCELLPDRDALPEALLAELGVMGFEAVEVDADDPYLEEVLARKHHKSSCHVDADNNKLTDEQVRSRLPKRWG